MTVDASLVTGSEGAAFRPRKKKRLKDRLRSIAKSRAEYKEGDGEHRHRLKLPSGEVVVTELDGEHTHGEEKTLKDRLRSIAGREGAKYDQTPSSILETLGRLLYANEGEGRWVTLKSGGTGTARVKIKGGKIDAGPKGLAPSDARRAIRAFGRLQKRRAGVFATPEEVIAHYAAVLAPYAGQFEEDKHPRANDGKFARKGEGGTGAKGDNVGTKADKDREEPTAKGEPAKKVGKQEATKSYKGAELKAFLAGKKVFDGVPAKAIQAIHQFDESEGGIARLIDRKGQRPRYVYTSEHEARAAAKKYSKIRDLHRSIDDFRDRVATDLAFGEGRDKAHAVAAALVDVAAIRMGGDAASKRTGSIGVSTLRREHVAIEEGSVKLSFPAKSGKQWEVVVTDPDLSSAIAELAEAKEPSDNLFGTSPRERINEYIANASFGATAKDFRTYHGTRVAREFLEGVKIEGEGKARERSIKKAISDSYKAASKFLRNTPSVAKTAYIDPAVIAEFQRRAKE